MMSIHMRIGGVPVPVLWATCEPVTVWTPPGRLAVYSLWSPFFGGLVQAHGGPGGVGHAVWRPGWVPDGGEDDGAYTRDACEALGGGRPR